MCGQFTRDRWIPCTHGQQRAKRFHLMTPSCCFRNVWCHLKGINAIVLKYVGTTPITIHQNITSSNFWRHAVYRCPGRESLLSNDKLQFWIECHNSWCHIYQLNICIALQPTNKQGKLWVVKSTTCWPQWAHTCTENVLKTRFQDVQNVNPEDVHKP